MENVIVKNCDNILEICDECVRYNDFIFCDDDCLLEFLDADCSTVTENDLDDSETIDTPLFNYKEPQDA